MCIRDRRGTKFSFTSRASIDQLSILPEYQNAYGQGFGGDFKFVDGAGGGVNDGADESWGPKLDGRLIDQFTGKQQPWIAHPDNIENYFRTGSTLSNNVNVPASNDAAGLRLSVGTDRTTGIVPNSSLNRLSGMLSGNATFWSKLTVNSSVQYTQ